MSKSDVERWSDDLAKYMEIAESTNVEDFDSVWDSILKKIVVAGVLSKDAHNLKAIDDTYFRIFNEEIQNIDTHLNSWKKMTKGISWEKFRQFVDGLFRSEVYILSMSINNHIIMLISLVAEKSKEEGEIAVLGEKLRQIVAEQEKAMREKMKTYVV